MGDVKQPAYFPRDWQQLVRRVERLERRVASVPDGVVVKSPNGTAWRITVSDTGAVSAVAA